MQKQQFHTQPIYKKKSSLKRIQGFTLIEVMIVIVILGVFAAIVGLSVGAGAVSKQVQKYDQLVDDLKYIRLLALDEQAVLGFKTITDDESTRYSVLKLNDAKLQAVIKQAKQQKDKVNQRKFGVFDGLSTGISTETELVNNKEKLWLPFVTEYERGIKRELDAQVELRIEPQESNKLASKNTPSDNPLFNQVNRETPQIIWFGNGEVTPVKLTMFVDNKQIGDTVFIDQLGKVTIDTGM